MGSWNQKIGKSRPRTKSTYFGNALKYPSNDFPSEDPRKWERDISLMDDLETGTKLRNTYAQMQRYKDAVWISGKIGDKEAQVRYAELSQTDPEELPGYRAILSRIEEREERYRYQVDTS